MSDDLKIQKAIKNYLLKNPAYFTQHPELITAMDVVTPTGELTDFTTHQLRSLQKENQQLKSQISQLIKNAQQSESMMNRLFTLLTELSVVKQGDFLPEFVAFVAAHFPSDYFKLLVAEGHLDLPTHALIETLTAAQVTQFSVFQAKSEPLSGRLKQEKIQSIFPQQDDIKSAVVLPVGVHAEFGMMAFASRDEEKFHPNLASDMLQKLCLILSAYFDQLQSKDENQAMP